MSIGWCILATLVVLYVAYLGYRFCKGLYLGYGFRKSLSEGDDGKGEKMGEFKVLYEVRTEQEDAVLERGAVWVKDVDRDFAFSVAAKQILDSQKKLKYRDIYVACIAVKEVE